MLNCIFHASGRCFDVDAYLASSRLEPYSIFRKGDVVGASRKKWECSGFKVKLNNSDETYDSQIDAAKQFIAHYEAELIALRDFPGVERIALDFGVSIYYKTAMTEYEMPHELSANLGLLHIETVISVYVTEIDPEPEEEYEYEK